MSTRMTSAMPFAYLTTPPEACGEGPAAARPQLLQLSSMGPKDFERLCFRLTRLRATVQMCRLYGVHGQAQKGIDLYARQVDGSYLVVQCKRSSDAFTPGEITEAVNTFLAGDWVGKTKEFILAVTANLEATQAADRIEVERPKLAQLGITFTVWDQTELSALLKENPLLVDDFFGREAVRTFLGDAAANALVDRLDAVDMIEYRSSLGSLYREVFHGLERGAHSDERSIPLSDRFVRPDVVVTDVTHSAEASTHTERPATDHYASQPAWHNKYLPDVTAGLRNPTALPAQTTSSSTIFGNRVNVTDWFAAGTQHLVVGVPGSGKSALLRMLVLDILADEPQLVGHLDRLHDLLPIWLPFGFWTNAARKNTNSVSVLDAVKDWLDTYDHGHLWPLIAKALNDERVLLIVDGLDEWATPDLARLCINRLEVFISTKHAGVLASSRPFSTAELPIDRSRWRVANLAPLDHEQRLAFITKWLTPLVEEHALVNEAAKWASEIEASSHLRVLSDIPLFLLLLLRSREQNTEFPEDLHAVLSDAISRLIGEHRRRKIDTSGAADHFPSTGDIRKVSAATAEQMHLATSITIGDDDLRDSFRHTFVDSIGYPPDEAHSMASALVNALSPGVGLMIRPAPDETQFFHRSVLEFLAAERLLNCPIEEQIGLFENHLTDRQWSQVLRFLIRGIIRPPEIAAIFETLSDAAIGDTLLREATDLLAADVAVGSGSTNAQTRRLLLDRITREIETGEREAHQAHLLDRLVPGLSRREMRDDLTQRFGGWLQAVSRERWSSVLRAASSWEPDEILLKLLWHALLADDDEVQRIACRVLGTKFSGKDDIAARLSELASTTRLDRRRAAAVEALSLGWPDHPVLDGLIANGREHSDFALRHASVAADLRRGNTTDANRTALTDLLDHAPGISAWSSWLMELMFEHYPDDQAIFDHYVSDADPNVKDQFRGGKAPSTFLILQGYTRRPEARDYFLKLISPNRKDFPRPASLLLTGRIPWKEIGDAYHDDPEVVSAVENLVREHLASAIGDSGLYECSLVAHTAWVRDQLISRVRAGQNWGLGWIIRALAEGWPDDTAVRSALIALVDSDTDSVAVSAIAHLTEIYTDPFVAMDRLAGIVPSSSNQGAVIDALNGIISHGGNREDPRVQVIVERALGSDLTSPWTSPEAPWTSPEAALYSGFPDHPPVRERALSRLADRTAPLDAIAYGFRDDPDVRKAITARFLPLSAPLRGRLIEGLADVPASDDSITSLLARYDGEPEPTVKLLAATAYARQLKDAEAVTDEIVDMFKEQARAVGLDHYERRAAAFCALAELGRLDVLTELREPFGDQKPVQIQYSPMGDSSLFYRYVCRFWDDIKSALGDNFSHRFGVASSSDSEFLENVLAVAHDYPASHDDIASILAQRPQLATSAAGISYLWRTARARDGQWEAIVALLKRGDTGSYNDIQPTWTALHVLVEEFADDPRTAAWLDGELAQIERDEADAEGKTHIWMLSFGTLAALARLRPGHRLIPTLLNAVTRVNGETWPTFHEWSELSAAAVTGAQEFIDLAVEISRIVLLNDMFPEYIHRPLTARLRRDADLAVALARLVPSLPEASCGIVIRLLAMSGHLDPALEDHLRALSNDAYEGSTATFDPLTGTTRHIQLLALDLLDTVDGYVEP